MGLDSRRNPLLPAPTDSDSISGTGTTELATDLSRRTDKTSYSLPEDGSPVTIPTRKKHGEIGISRESHNSQTSLLIEYFEGSKPNQSQTRRPSVRVKVTPSSKSRSRSTNEHIQITETSKSGRKPSYTKRINLSSPQTKGDKVSELEVDNKSEGSYASATEESNVSRNPIEVEIMAPRRHGSPLIPTGNTVSQQDVQLGSDVSSMPANSFLDGKSGFRSPERKRSRSVTRGEALAAGAAAGVATAAIAEGLKSPSRRRSRSLSRERIVAQKVAEKVRSDKSERRHKHGGGSRSRSVSNSEKHTEKHTETVKSPRRRSSRSHVEDSLISGGDSSLLTGSRVSADQRSFRSGTSKSSINNPKLLETVEDAIRRLILPELTALKKEQKANADRHKLERDRRGSITSGSGVSRESREEESSTRRVSHRTSPPDISVKPKIRVNDRDVSGETVKLRKHRKSDRSESDGSPSSRSFERGGSEETIVRENERSHEKPRTDKKSTLGALAAGIGLGALTSAALKHHDSKEEVIDERQERRRRRAKSRSRSDSLAESYEELHQEHPPMPMMSDINSSELTRTSILSAETERPHSASAEHRLTPVRDVIRGTVSPSPHTPTKSSTSIHRGLGLHGNDSRVDLSKENVYEEEYELNEHGQKVPRVRSQSPVYSEDYEEEEEQQHKGGLSSMKAGLIGAAGGALLGAAAMHRRNAQHDFDSPDDEDEEEIYQHDQQVPSPLRYVPYNQQKRGLSPIQSVSGYTEADELDRQHQYQQRDSGLTRSTGSYSTLDQSPRKVIAKSVRSERSNPLYHDFQDVRQGGLTDSELTQDPDGEYWEEQRRGNDKNLDVDQESYRSSGPQTDYHHMNNNYTDDGIDEPYGDQVAAGQNVREIRANPDYVSTPIAVESAVASLVSGSGFTGGSGHSNLDRKASYASYDEGSERHFTSRGNSPQKYDDGSQDMEYEGSDRAERTRHRSPAQYTEYELDEHGRKVTMPEYKNSHTAAKAGIAGIAAGAAAAVLANRYHQPTSSQSLYEERKETTGAPLQKSFKDRASEFQGQFASPRHSVDKLTGEDESHEHIKMGTSGIPDLHDPMPEIGYGGDDASDITSNHSVVQGPIGGNHHGNQDHWPNHATPPQSRLEKLDTSSAVRSHQSDSGLRAAELGLLGAAAGAGAAAALTNHNRETGHDHNEEWQRTSEERKRDTLITNPYEGTSPVTLLGGQHDRNMLDELGYKGVKQDYGDGKLGYSAGSPGLLQKDEGYISSAPNALSPDGVTTQRRAKGVGFMDDVGMDFGAEDFAAEDPFYTPKHNRNISDMSHGMGSPLYDSALGHGKDRIQSKDIVALMDHLTVRDEYRNARDTEILMTLVQAAAEMRNSFEDMKRLLADTEDVIITEVQRNTDKSVQKAINGPRPLPQSGSRSTRESQDGMIEDIPSRKRNVFRRALRGLSLRSNNDLAKIEDMLMQLLGDVEGLKVAQGLPGRSPADGDYDFEEVAYEQDGGYEPEGHAGTSTASHASQSGHFSNPLSRGTSARGGLEGRRFSENRISTVPEGDEEELDPHEAAILDNQFEHNEQLLTPVRDNIRAGSAPLATPPQQYIPPASISNENTPKTDQSKKHKSSGSFGWNPISKISRWSETTASTVARGFRSSGRRDTEQFEQPPSRSGSDLGNYDQPLHDPYGTDKLHSGFSQENVAPDPYQNRGLTSLLPPEDPKYKAHRNSLNLQHPQPRQGPTHRYQTALESQAQDFSHPMSPSSMDFGSSTSVNRLPQNANANRYSNGTTGTGMSEDTGRYSGQGGGLVAAPARPPKEPLNNGPEVPPKVRPNKLTKPSPLSNEHLSSADLGEEKRFSNGTASTAAQYENSPKAATRVLSGVGVPTRKPTGPRSMGESLRSRSGNLSVDDPTIPPRNKNRDTFGTIASPRHSNHSGESETF